MLRAVGAVQLDTISVLARSHELVAYARLGAVGRDKVEAAYWGRPARAFEYWAHAMCVLPIEEWPFFAARRRARARWTHPRRPHDDRAVAQVLDILRERGPITSADFGGSRSSAPRSPTVWWHWSPLKIAVERLLSIGAVVCVERRGWRRVYDLAERAIPAKLLRKEVSDEECHAHLVARAAERLGVGTLRDLAGYFAGIDGREARAAAEAARLVPVRVRGWKDEAWADRRALALLAAGGLRGRHRTTLLSPFDPLVWDRDRTRRVFGFHHVFEAYVPAAKRVHGYFTMPLLAGGRLVGGVDPGREGKTLVAKRVTLAGPPVAAAASALVEAARWVDCDAVDVRAVSPARLRAPLRLALRRAT